PLSETGRLRLARCVVEERWPLRRTAERFQVSPTTAWRWASRYRTLGAAGMADRSSRPHRSPRRTPTRTERRIIKVRVLRRWGPARIGYMLGVHPSTVHRVLTRYGLAKLRWLDRATGRVVRRMESARCGDLVHVDVKKLGKIPAGGGWRMLGRSAGKRHAQADKTGMLNKHHQPLRGYHFLHTAIDAHSRLAYSELLADERQQTAAAFWIRANTWFAQCGINQRSEGVDRQRILLPISHLRRDLGRHRTPAHPTLPTPNQRESGAIPPHLGRRMGLRPSLHLRRRALPSISTLAAHLQSL
ncbi:hypothetical protein HMPREF0591_1586, partial [Mycobacterium parascrofulaceum ATCC BAA-614]